MKASLLPPPRRLGAAALLEKRGERAEVVDRGCDQSLRGEDTSSAEPSMQLKVGPASRGTCPAQQTSIGEGLGGPGVAGNSL